MNTESSNDSSNFFKIFNEYNDDSYFSKYGMDVILTIFTLFVIILLIMYIRVQSNKNYYIYGKYTDEDGNQKPIWERERCKPHILPFSGNLYRPDQSKSAFETTMNNFEECIKSPFDKSNLEMVNPFRLLANTVSVLLTTLTAIISGIRSYVQSILDIIFTRFKANKELLNNVQMDIMKRFVVGVYDKLNESFKTLKTSITTFTTDTYEKTVGAAISHIQITIKEYFKQWFETLFYKILGGNILRISAASLVLGYLIGPFGLGLVIAGIIGIIASAILLGISKEMSVEMQSHYNLLSAAGKTVIAPIGGAADWTTDKQFSTFYGREYNTETITNDFGQIETKVENFNEPVRGGNIDKITELTKASVGDLMSAWNFYSSGIWQKSIETNWEIIADMKNLSDEDAQKIKDSDTTFTDWPENFGGTGVDRYQKNIKRLKRYLGQKESGSDDDPEEGQLEFFKDNVRKCIRIKFNSEGWNEILEKNKIADDTGCPNLFMYVDKEQEHILILNATWEGFILGTPDTAGGEVKTKEFIKNVMADGGNYTTRKPKDGDKITNGQERLWASRMWYWNDDVHICDVGSIAIRQGDNGSYAEGDIIFTLNAWVIKKNDADFTDTGDLGTHNWSRNFSFKNKAALDAECMSGCFGKNTDIKLNNGRMKAIYKIKPGDILENNNKVNAVMKCKLSGKSLYKLNETIVTSHHRVFNNGEFIECHKHPDATLYDNKNYGDKFVYCLTTDNKTINIGEHVFTDWDELTDKDISSLKLTLSNEFEREQENKNRENKNRENKNIGKIIHKHIDSGFHPYMTIKLKNGETRYLKDIKHGDILDNSSSVSAIIKIDASDIDIYKHDIDGNSIFGTANLTYVNHNKIKTTYYNENKREPYNLNEDKTKVKYLYHILTNTGSFTINNIEFTCYNKNLEIFL